MSAPLTEAEAVRRERAAFLAGGEEAYRQVMAREAAPALRNQWRCLAHATYPLPTVERPRVLTLDNGAQFRVQDGLIEHRSKRDGWVQSDMELCEFTADDFRQFADLMENPTETVEVAE